MSFVTAALIGAGGIIAGGVISGSMAKSAAKTQAGAAAQAAQAEADAANAANQVQLQIYQQQREDLAPWRQTGANALNFLAGYPTAPMYRGPGEFTESPSYQFALNQGLQGMQRAASASGRLGSGAYLKDATQYAKNLASEEYQNFLNRYYQSLSPWMNLAQMGQASAAGTANAAGQYGQNVGNNLIGAGNAMGQGISNAGNAVAAGQLGMGNTIANTLNWGAQQGMDAIAQNQLMNLYKQQLNQGNSYGSGGWASNPNAYGMPSYSLPPLKLNS